MAVELAIPTQFSDITADWLTAALRERGHLPQGRVSAVNVERFGEGVGLMGQIARLRLQYEGAPDSPTSFVVKIPANEGPNRQMCVDYRIYEKEVFFYEHLAPRVSLRTPKPYYSAFNPENHDFVLLLEDLAPAEVGSELTPISDDRVRVAVRELAKFHAYWWDTDELRALDKIPYLSDPIWRQHTQLFEFAWPLWKEQFGPTVSAYCLETAERWGHAVAKLLDKLSEPPCTIIHMDYQLPNLFFRGPDGGVDFAVADWQPYSRAKGPYDLAYFLSESIPTEQRRRLQDEMLRLYHATLLENGVRDYPYEQFFEDFRLGVAYTILYPMGTVTVDLANEHGRAYQRAINERHMASVEDFQVGDVIPD